MYLKTSFHFFLFLSPSSVFLSLHSTPPPPASPHFLSRVSSSKGRPQTHCVDRSGLKLLTPLPCPGMTGLCHCARPGSQVQLCLSPSARFSQQQSFVQLLQEVNDFAGQRELVAESLGIRVCLELAKYSQEMKQERKMVRRPSYPCLLRILLEPH